MDRQIDQLLNDGWLKDRGINKHMDGWMDDKLMIRRTPT